MFSEFVHPNETPRGKQRGIKIPTAQDKSRSKLRGTIPKEIREVNLQKVAV